jgi:hypothetical protein
MTMAITNNVKAQQLDFAKVKTYEHQLDDVMEIIDTTELKTKLIEVEQQFQSAPTEINKVRLGIIYHETALNLGFFAKTSFKGYSKKSFDVLSELYLDPKTTNELLPFVTSYRASALSLLSGETNKLSYLSEAFKLFNEAVTNYAAVIYAPEFMRGSVSENLPWFMFKKRSYSKKDFDAIIKKYEVDNSYATAKIMSFTYWAWAMQHQSKKYRTASISYLDKAIALDPNYKAGRQRAEELKTKIRK